MKVMARTTTIALSGALGIGLWSCAGSHTSKQPTGAAQRQRRAIAASSKAASSVAVVKQSPPPSGEARDVSFPPIVRSTLPNGLEINTVELHELPVAYLRLVVRSGAETDPGDRAGLSKLVAAMLEEGTKSRKSAEFSEEVEFLGADFSAWSDEENLYLGIQALSRDLPAVLAILADAALHPAFRADELKKLKRREIDRLRLREQDPSFLGAREFYKRVYGGHPYARIDTTVEVVDKLKRQDLSDWHRRFVVPNNAFLVVVGDVSAEAVRQSAEQVFKAWKGHPVAAPTYPSLPTRVGREVVVVDRPGSVQSNILIGNAALARRDPNYVPLLVANQVLGGSAASRLFMDLREKRSLTYGAYSSVGQSVETAAFRASAAVRTEVTGEALKGFFEHLQRIVSEAPPAEELRHAEQYLSDRFPLQIDTPGKVASMVGEARIFGLADDYWDSYRSQIRSITSSQALQAARRYVLPEQALVVVVGDAKKIAPQIQGFGTVTSVDAKGAPVRDP